MVQCQLASSQKMETDGETVVVSNIFHPGGAMDNDLCNLSLRIIWGEICLLNAGQSFRHAGGRARHQPLTFLLTLSIARSIWSWSQTSQSYSNQRCCFRQWEKSCMGFPLSITISVLPSEWFWIHLGGFGYIHSWCGFHLKNESFS